MVVEKCLINSEVTLRFYSSNSFQCYLTNFSKILVEINFGWICNFLIFVIIGISIFGKIKENYRWLILYQALFDFGITYDFICENPIQKLHFDSIDGTCFYSDGVSWRYLESIRIYVIPIFKEWIKNSPYLAVFLLAFTRFLALYFMNFYKKITEKRRIFWLLLGFGFGYTVTIAGWQIFDKLYNDERIEVSSFCNKKFQSCYSVCENMTETGDEKYEKCYPNCNKKIANCEMEPLNLQILTIFWKAFLAIHYLLNLLLLLASSISIICIIAKISKQAKFQSKHNKKDFHASLRIATVLGLQTIITTALFIIEFFREFKDILFLFFYINAYPGTSIPGYTNIDLEFPEWLDGNYGLTKNLQTLRQLRIFLEAIFVLTIMTGYREAWVALVKFVYNAVKDPRKIYQRSTATALPSRTGSSKIAWPKK